MYIENAKLMSNLPPQLFQFDFEINKTSVFNIYAHQLQSSSQLYMWAFCLSHDALSKAPG